MIFSCAASDLLNHEAQGTFASVHPRSKTPYVSVLVYAAVVWALAMLGTFNWNAKLSAVSRLITYVFMWGSNSEGDATASLLVMIPLIWAVPCINRRI